MSKIGLDSRHFPLVFQHFHAGFTDADVETVIAGYEALLARNEPYAMVVSTDRNASIPTALQRKRFGEWWRARRGPLRRLNVGSATVVESSIVRGVITAIYWFVDPPSPQYMASNVDEAVDWCVARLNEAGIAVPPEARAHRYVAKSA